ncbi:GH1 family beta-glucosidase [Puniceicoccaceae bacterium K14]|nr:GH1 family beta-glucosidase [Puniceicoccaceae bacterium K14]
MEFPKNFTWGAGASSYQIEGAAYDGGKGLSIWDKFCKSPGKIYKAQTGDVACDHYNRFLDDVSLMKEVGLKAYRFSVSWPRVIPNGYGKVNEAGLDFYDRLVDALLAVNIEPWITLYHWELPWQLHLEGGWLNPNISDRFAEYTSVVAKRLSDRVSRWITINEVQVIVGLGYGSGIHAPGLKLSLHEILQAGHHVQLAHGKSVQTLRANAKRPVLIGGAPVGVVSRPNTESPEDIEAARMATFDVVPPESTDPMAMQNGIWNSAWWMDPMFKGEYPENGLEAYREHLPEMSDGDLDIIFQPLDFLGANIYHGRTVKADGNGGYEILNMPDGSPLTTMGWDIVPDILYWGSKYLYERYGKPIVVTENGTATTDFPDENGEVIDSARCSYLKEHLKGISRVAADGVECMGYFHWSIMDNFEWDRGYSQRFGIVYVNYQTQERILKQSAKEYRDVIESNGASLSVSKACEV